MAAANIKPEIRAWYSHYLKNRTVTADVKGTRSIKRIKKGTPQGGVLSPLVWNLAFDDLLSQFDEGPVHIKGFVDDAVLLVCGPHPYTLVQLMQRAINKANAWGLSKGLTFSHEKTVAVIFSHKRDPTKLFPSLKLGSNDISYEKQVRYLGITLDLSLIHI